MKRLPAAKTLLTLMPQIDEYCDAIKKSSHVHALQSFYGLTDTERLAQQMIDKAYRCAYLQDLKSKIEMELDAMPVKLGKVLRFYFLERKKPEQIAILISRSERSIFRLLGQALEVFSNRLENFGLNSFTFRTLLQENRWIREEYERCLQTQT